MAVIGKVYANSMLVLLNRRIMLLGPEKTPSMIISSLNFGAAPANDSHVLPPVGTNPYTTNFPFKRRLPLNLEACYTCAWT
jgi:hypothetical protein